MNKQHDENSTMQANPYRTADMEYRLKSKYSARLNALLALEPDSDPFERTGVRFEVPWNEAYGAFAWADDDGQHLYTRTSADEMFEKTSGDEDAIARGLCSHVISIELRHKINDVFLKLNADEINDSITARSREIMSKLDENWSDGNVENRNAAVEE